MTVPLLLNLCLPVPICLKLAIDAALDCVEVTDFSSDGNGTKATSWTVLIVVLVDLVDLLLPPKDFADDLPEDLEDFLEAPDFPVLEVLTDLSHLLNYVLQVKSI